MRLYDEPANVVLLLMILFIHVLMLTVSGPDAVFFLGAGMTFAVYVVSFSVVCHRIFFRQQYVVETLVRTFRTGDALPLPAVCALLSSWRKCTISRTLWWAGISGALSLVVAAVIQLLFSSYWSPWGHVASALLLWSGLVSYAYWQLTRARADTGSDLSKEASNAVQDLWQRD